MNAKAHAADEHRAIDMALLPLFGFTYVHKYELTRVQVCKELFRIHEFLKRRTGRQ